ncbi:MAG: hypothetical protein KGJ07_00145 [Patescibacteria group bacterium]|nr:hypothetical protein [Patescibacteria group bacterium]
MNDEEIMTVKEIMRTQASQYMQGIKNGIQFTLEREIRHAMPHIKNESLTPVIEKAVDIIFDEYLRECRLIREEFTLKEMK